jgi:uncharacterized membrane protein
LQGATDLAAIAAATNLAEANQAADATAARNGYLASEVTAVTPGIYTADPNLPPSQRFVPSAPSVANAAQVTMTHNQELFFAPTFRLAEGPGSQVADHATLVTQGMAMVNRSISFAIGSRVAAFNGGIVNALLGATVGSQVSLDLVDYNALATTQVDLFGMARAIALQIGQVNPTYGQVAGQTISTAQFIAALQQAAPAIAPQLQILADAAQGQATTVDLSRLIQFGQYSQQSVAAPEPELTATASALGLLQAAAQVGGEPHLINLNLNAGIPGIAAVTGMMTIGEPAQGTTIMAVSQLGTSVHTAQIRLFLDVSLAGSVDSALVHLPLYLEVGYGTASFGGLACNVLDSAYTKATLNVTPGLFNGWVGTVSPSDMTNYTREPVPGAATLLNVPLLLTVTGRANASVGNVNPVQVDFSAADIQNVAIKTSSTTDFVGALLNSLVGNLQMQVKLAGLGIGVPPGLTASINGVLQPAVAPVDQLISTVLQTAGVGLGQADTWVSGANCSAAALSG